MKKLTEKTILGLFFVMMMFLLSMSMVQAVNITTCGAYSNVSNTEYEIVNDITFSENNIFYPCLYFVDSTNVTINGNGYKITNTNVLPYSNGIIIDNMNDTIIKNIIFENMVSGVYQTYYIGVIGGSTPKANYTCSSNNVLIENIQTTNVSSAVYMKCYQDEITTLQVSPSFYTRNITINNITSTGINTQTSNSEGLISVDGVDGLIVDNININNYFVSTSFNIFGSDFGNNILVSNINATNFRGRGIAIFSNTTNVIVENIASLNSDMRLAISTLSENLTIRNVNANGQWNISSASSNSVIVITGSSTEYFPKNVYIENISFSNIYSSSAMLSVTNNAQNVNINNINFTNVRFSSTNQLININAGATSINPLRSTNISNIYINNVTKRTGQFINLNSKDIMIDNVLFNGLSVDATANQSLRDVLVIFNFGTLSINNTMKNIVINPLTNTNNTIGIIVNNATNVYFENVTNLKDYIPTNYTCNTNPCAPFITHLAINQHINVNSANNTGWFPQNATKLYATINLMRYSDIALYNTTNDLLINDTINPFTYYSTNTYRIFNNNISQIVECVEDWVLENSGCNLPQSTGVIFYSDNNMCGTYNDLPVNNGTVINCSITNSMSITLPVCDSVYDTGIDGMTNITINYNWSQATNLIQQNVVYEIRDCDRYNLDNCHGLSNFQLNDTNATFSGIFALDVSSLVGDHYLQVIAVNDYYQTEVANQTCYYYICEGDCPVEQQIGGFVIHEVDTTDLTSMIIALLIIVILLGIGFGLWMGFKGKQTDNEYNKFVLPIVATVVVIAMIFLTVAILIG